MAAPTISCLKKFVLHFVNEHVEFRLPELRSLASVIGSHVVVDENVDNQHCPFVVVELSNETAAKNIAQKSVLIRSLHEYWGSGSSLSELHKQLLSLPKSFLNEHTRDSKTFRVCVESFNQSLSSTDKIRRIESLPLDQMGFTGRVRLQNPDTSLHLFEYYSNSGSRSSQALPQCVYFGRWLADGQRARIKDFDLKQRHFIGHTSMDTCLSLLMANIAQVTPNSLVYDPFVGTGSLCVACAHAGAYVTGTDIDYMILHGKGRSSRHNQTMRGPDENIRANMRQYGLEHLYLDILVGDSSLHDLWRVDSLFDAIVTDPPYGIREAAKKIASQSSNDENENGESLHVPKCEAYQLSDIFLDLLNFSARFLRPRGHLVYWLPVYRSEYTPDNIPTHPCLKLVSNSEQILSSKCSRHLICMQKTRTYCEEDVGKAALAKDHYGDVTFRDRYFNLVTDTGQPPDEDVKLKL